MLWVVDCRCNHAVMRYVVAVLVVTAYWSPLWSSYVTGDQVSPSPDAVLPFGQSDYVILAIRWRSRDIVTIAKCDQPQPSVRG